jgi:hypothetical protein
MRIKHLTLFIPGISILLIFTSVAKAEESLESKKFHVVTLYDSNPLSRNNLSGLWKNVFLPMCKNEEDTDCIVSLSIYPDGGKEEKPDYIGQAPGLSYPAQQDQLIPRSGEAQLFESRIDGKVQKYSLKVIENIFAPSKVSRQIRHTEFSIFVQPYIDVPSALSSESSPYDALEFAWHGNGIAGKAINFEKNIRASVKIRIPSDSGGWFSGRVRDPKVSLNSINKMNELTIDALPAVVSRLDAYLPGEKIAAVMGDLPLGGIEASSQNSLSYVEKLRESLSDRATSESSVWVVKSTFVKNKCFPDDKFSGFVTTNAMAYSSNPPTFQNGYLDYKVAGMHFNSDGTLATGSYDLILSSETARCIYQFSSAPINASVSIIGENSESRTVETSVLNESEGFLKLSANGFGFSTPIIRVQLHQNPVPSNTSAPSASKVQMRTIRCIKGTVLKKVTAVNAKCPSGFKKK